MHVHRSTRPILAALLMLVPVLASATALNLEAQASAKVDNDEMTVSLAAVRTGPSVAPLNESVLSALNDAARTARAVPGIEVRLGGVTTNPDWRDGKPAGWQVRGELVLNSRDIKALSELSGRLGGKLQFTGVSFGLSQETRLAQENRLLEEAAARFRARSAAAVKAFGYQRYEIEELALNQPLPPRPMMRSMAVGEAAIASAAPLPAEGGESEVVVSVSGRIRMD